MDSRKALGITQARLAEMAQAPRLAVIRAEAGEGLTARFQALGKVLDLAIDGHNLPAGNGVGQRLALLREERRLSQNEVAAMASVTRQTVGSIEQGRYGHLSAVQALGNALGAGLIVRRQASKGFWTSTAASSISERWTTPPDLLEALYKAIGTFDLDPCSPRRDGPVRARLRFTEKDNGLVLPWIEGKVFCNPPYGPSIKLWTERCRTQAERRQGLIVGLVPARVDTGWW